MKGLRKSYVIYGFAYPYDGFLEEKKETRFLLIAMFWITLFRIKYDGVEIFIRER